MSSFSSVIRKPGQKIVPKGAPRRITQRKPASEPSTALSQAPEGDHGAVESDASTVDRQASREHSRPPPTLPATDTELHEEHRNSAPIDTNSTQTQTQTHSSEDGGSVALGGRANSQQDSRSHTSDPVDQITERLQTNEEHVPTRQSPRGMKRKIQHTHTAESPVEVGSKGTPNDSNTVSESTRATSSSPAQSVESQKENINIHRTQQRQSRSVTRAMSDITIVQPTPQPGSVIAVPRIPSRRRSSNISQSSSDLFRSATSRAASVSELAQEIDNQTAANQRRYTQQEDSTQGEVITTETPASSGGRSSKPKRRKKTAQEQAADVIASVMGESQRGRRRRNVTPDDAEEYELDPDEMTMGKLCKDNKLGKKSALEAEMEANWPEILQRRKEDKERALEAAQKRTRKTFNRAAAIEPLQATVAIGPQTMIVNGKIVVVNESREIDRSAQLEQAAVIDETNVREDKHYFKRVNQATVGMKPMRGQKFWWDDESTQKFYKGLRMFGTDFAMIANMFPGLDRKQIKRKFIREENADKAGIMQHLQNREAVNLEEYSEIANIEFQDVKEIEDAMKAEEERLRSEDNERRKREGYAANPSDLTLPSQGGEEHDPDNPDGAAEGPGRYAALAADILAPKKKQQRKTTAANKKRGPRGGARMEGGIEEMLGSIDEVQV